MNRRAFFAALVGAPVALPPVLRELSQADRKRRSRARPKPWYHPYNSPKDYYLHLYETEGPESVPAEFRGWISHKAFWRDQARRRFNNGVIGRFDDVRFVET